MTKEHKGMLYVIIFELMAGFTTYAIKQINPVFPSSLLVFTRFGLASLSFLVFISLQSKYRKEVLTIPKKQLLYLLYLGAIGSGVVSTIYVLSVRYIGITLSTIIASLEIPLGILFAVIFLKERLTLRFVLISILTLFGFFLLLFQNTIPTDVNTLFFVGVFFAVLSAVIWASATLVGKNLLTKNVSVVVVPFFRNFFAMICALVIAILSSVSIVSSYSLLQTSDWLWIIYIGVGVSGLGFVIYYKALQTVEVKKISLFFTISPVFGVVLGVFAGEVFSLGQWVGVVTILVGIALLLRNPDKIIIAEEKNQAV